MLRWLAISATVTAALGAGNAASSARTQSDLASRVEGVRDGAVRLSFRAREFVCGDGRSTSLSDDGNRYWERECQRGPVRVVIQREGGRTVDLEAFVGGRWKQGDDVTDLGTVGAVEAARYFLSLVREGAPFVSKRAILPAQLADSVELWPELLEIARDPSIPHETRKSAVFWVSQAASEKAVDGLEALADDDDEELDLRERAVFALAQLDHEESVPALIRLATEHREPQIRKRALFWLGQKDDPRALDLFEEILTRRR